MPPRWEAHEKVQADLDGDADAIRSAIRMSWERQRQAKRTPVLRDVDEWEAAVVELWGRSVALDRDRAVQEMRELNAACPAADGRAAF